MRIRVRSAKEVWQQTIVRIFRPPLSRPDSVSLQLIHLVDQGCFGLIFNAVLLRNSAPWVHAVWVAAMTPIDFCKFANQCKPIRRPNWPDRLIGEFLRDTERHALYLNSPPRHRKNLRHSECLIRGPLSAAPRQNSPRRQNQ